MTHSLRNNCIAIMIHVLDDPSQLHSIFSGATAADELNTIS